MRPARRDESPPPMDVGAGYERALAWYRARVPMTRDEWDALGTDARQRAFTVSGVTQLRVVEEVWRSLERVVVSGQRFEDWKREVAPALLDAWRGSVANPSARMETIFRTNVQSAYNAGRVAQMREPAVLRARPFWLFDAVLDGRTTETCRPLNGTILPAEDPWWTTHQPPLHFNCRSGIRNLRRADAERRGITSTPPAGEAAEGFGGATGEPDLSGTPRRLQGVQHARMLAPGEPTEAIDVRTAEEGLGQTVGRPEVVAWLERHGVQVQVQRDLLEYLDKRERPREAIGLYNSDTRVILLSLHVGRYQGQFHPGDDFVGVGASTARDAFDRLAVHELGHAILSHSSETVRDEVLARWHAAMHEGRILSRGAAVDAHEYFAECLVAYLFERDDLAELDREMVVLIRRILRDEGLGEE